LCKYSSDDTYASGKNPHRTAYYVCTCGNVNLNITDKPEDNDFIPYMTLNDLLSQVVELVILQATIVGFEKSWFYLKK